VLCIDCGVNPRVSDDDDCDFCQQCYDLDNKGFYAIFAPKVEAALIQDYLTPISPSPKVVRLCSDCAVKPCASNNNFDLCQQCYEDDNKGFYAIFAPKVEAQWPEELRSDSAKAFAANAMDKMRAYWKTAIVCRECGVIPCESPDDICQTCAEEHFTAKNPGDSWFWRTTFKTPK